MPVGVCNSSTIWYTLHVMANHDLAERSEIHTVSDEYNISIIQSPCFLQELCESVQRSSPIHTPSLHWNVASAPPPVHRAVHSDECGTSV